MLKRLENLFEKGKIKMRKTNIKITRYEERGYFVDIQEYDDGFEAWITKVGFGASMFMYGCDKDQGDGFILTHDGFKSNVEANLDEYIEAYSV